MDEVQCIFFAPSLDWFKAMAKQLRQRIGWDTAQYYESMNLLARMYGFVSWFEYLEYHNHDEEYITFWDSELDERSFGDRWWLQILELKSTLEIGEAEAMEILADVRVSSELKAVSDSTQRDDIEAFSFALKEMLDEHREATAHASEAALSKTVVTCKKRHRMGPRGGAVEGSLASKFDVPLVPGVVEAHLFSRSPRGASRCSAG